MGKQIDITGQKFGKLTAIKRAEDYISPSGRREVKWLCLCDCGNKIIVRRSSLVSGQNTQSCGCLRFKNIDIPDDNNDGFKELCDYVNDNIMNYRANEVFAEWIEKKLKNFTVYNESNDCYVTFSHKATLKLFESCQKKIKNKIKQLEEKEYFDDDWHKFCYACKIIQSYVNQKIRKNTKNRQNEFLDLDDNTINELIKKDIAFISTENDEVFLNFKEGKIYLNNLN